MLRTTPRHVALTGYSRTLHAALRRSEYFMSRVSQPVNFARTSNAILNEYDVHLSLSLSLCLPACLPLSFHTRSRKSACTNRNDVPIVTEKVENSLVTSDKAKHRNCSNEPFVCLDLILERYQSPLSQICCTQHLHYDFLLTSKKKKKKKACHCNVPFLSSHYVVVLFKFELTVNQIRDLIRPTPATSLRSQNSKRS